MVRFFFFFFSLRVKSTGKMGREKTHTQLRQITTTRRKPNKRRLGRRGAVERTVQLSLHLPPSFCVYVARLNLVFFFKKRGGILSTQLVVRMRRWSPFLKCYVSPFSEPHFRDFLSLLTGDRGCFLFFSLTRMVIAFAPPLAKEKWGAKMTL